MDRKFLVDLPRHTDLQHLRAVHRNQNLPGLDIQGVSVALQQLTSRRQVGRRKSSRRNQAIGPPLVNAARRLRPRHRIAWLEGFRAMQNARVGLKAAADPTTVTSRLPRIAEVAAALVVFSRGPKAATARNDAIGWLRITEAAVNNSARIPPRVRELLRRLIVDHASYDASCFALRIASNKRPSCRGETTRPASVSTLCTNMRSCSGSTIIT